MAYSTRDEKTKSCDPVIQTSMAFMYETRGNPFTASYNILDISCRLTLIYCCLLLGNGEKSSHGECHSCWGYLQIDPEGGPAHHKD